MRNMSNAYLKTMEERRDFYAVAEITFQDGTVKTLDKRDFSLSGNAVVQSAGSSTFPLGMVIPRTATICLMNDDDRWSEYDFFGAKIFLKTKFDLNNGLTESINVGNFTVVTPESYGTTIEITATDDSYKLDKEYSTNITYPATIQTALLDSCRTCGVNLLSSTFKNSNFMIEKQPEDLSHRQFVGMCAMIAGGNAFFDEHNRLVIKTYDFSEFKAAGLDGGYFDVGNPSRYTSGDSADGGSFNPWNTGDTFDGGTFNDIRNIHFLQTFKNGLKIGTDDVLITGVKLTGKEKESWVYGSEKYMLVMENQLTAGKEPEAIRLIGQSIVGLRFRPFTGDSVAYPLADVMDLALLIDRKGNVYKTVITDVDFQYYGFTTLKCSADSPIRNSGKYYGNEVKALIESRQLIEEERTEREKAVELLAQELAQRSGLFMKKDIQEDGSAIYYMHDKPTLEESMIVWKLTANAFGISTDGGKTYPYGIDVTGMAILNRIYAVGINCDYLTTGKFTIYKGNKLMVSMDKDTGKVVIIADEFSLSNGKTIDDIANDAVDAQTQESIFNKLTNNGETQGIYLLNGKLYINGSYMQIGKISSRNGSVYFDLDKSELVCNKMISSSGDYGTRTVADISPGENLIYEQSNVFKVYSTDSPKIAIEVGTDRNGNGSVGAVKTLYLGTADGDGSVEITGYSVTLDGYANVTEDLDVYGNVSVSGGISLEEKLAVKGTATVEGIAYANGGMNVKESFNILNSTSCNVRADVDMHNYTLKNVKLSGIAASVDFKSYAISNVKLSNLESINGYNTFSGTIPIITKIQTNGSGIITNFWNSTITVRNGIITNAPTS